MRWPEPSIMALMKDLAYNIFSLGQLALIPFVSNLPTAKAWKLLEKLYRFVACARVAECLENAIPSIVERHAFQHSNQVSDLTGKGIMVEESLAYLGKVEGRRLGGDLDRYGTPRYRSILRGQEHPVFNF